MRLGYGLIIFVYIYISIESICVLQQFLFGRCSGEWCESLEGFFCAQHGGLNICFTWTLQVCKFAILFKKKNVPEYFLLMISMNLRLVRFFFRRIFQYCVDLFTVKPCLRWPWSFLALLRLKSKTFIRWTVF